MFVHVGRPVCAMVHNIISREYIQGGSERRFSRDLPIICDRPDI